MRYLMALALALGVALAGPADLLKEGEFQAAYRQALDAGQYVLAARAASFYAMYQAKDRSAKEAWFDRAEKAAREAIRQNPNDPEGYFELARALGRLAQYRGILQSLSLASAVRDNLNKALALKPDYAGAMVALALWNLELAQKGVGWLYGARIGRVIPLFEKAIRLEPEEIIHRVEYASALARMGKKQAALAQLNAALGLAPKDARDRYEQERAQRLLAQLLGR